jgi:hypothetical protein
MTEPQHRRAIEARRRRIELTGIALAALGSLAIVATFIVVFGPWSLSLFAGLALVLWGWFLASSTDEPSTGTSPGTGTGTSYRDDRDIEIDTDNPDPGAFIPDAPGTFTPPPQSRDSTRD